MNAPTKIKEALGFSSLNTDEQQILSEFWDTLGPRSQVEIWEVAMGSVMPFESLRAACKRDTLAPGLAKLKVLLQAVRE